MATTVNDAFSDFSKNNVDIDPANNSTAKGSKTWLMDRIHEFDETEGFVKLYNDIDMDYGSYARKTKVAPLDDIDLMIGMSGQGSVYNSLIGENKFEITVPEYKTSLSVFCNEGTRVLNSRKVINAFVTKLAEIPQYAKAEIKRNGAACVLNLTSYDWNYDIVPCFITTEEFGRTYYMIPDGDGNWMKTDPRIDKQRVISINQKHNGNILKVVRLVKYWQKRATMPSMGSYLLETLVLNYFESKTDVANPWPDAHLPEIFQTIGNKILYNVSDPKGIMININNLSYDDRQKIYAKAINDAQVASEARELESKGNHEAAINKWRSIFGTNFLKYE